MPETHPLILALEILSGYPGGRIRSNESHSVSDCGGDRLRADAVGMDPELSLVVFCARPGAPLRLRLAMWPRFCGTGIPACVVLELETGQTTQAGMPVPQRGAVSGIRYRTSETVY